jgi:membrane protease YdiL (CAAX protease family)
VLLSVPFVIVVSALGGILALIAAGIVGGDVGGDVELPTYGLFIAVLIQQIGQGLWPWLVSKRKGLGMRSDWRFAVSLPRDLGYGLLLAIVCLIGAGLATAGMASLVGLEDTSEASNTTILSDNQGSVWLIGVVALVVVGAPLTEELLFRGLIMRAFEKSFGRVVAVIGSTLMFTLPHIQSGATWQETLVLLAAIAVIGLVLGIGAMLTDRLGTVIFAHFLFNLVGTIATLA